MGADELPDLGKEADVGVAAGAQGLPVEHGTSDVDGFEWADDFALAAFAGDDGEDVSHGEKE